MGAEQSVPPSPLATIKSALSAQCGDPDKSAMEDVEDAVSDNDDQLVSDFMGMLPKPASEAVESEYLYEHEDGPGMHLLTWEDGATYEGHLILREGHGSIHHIGPHVDICEHPVKAGLGKMEGYGTWTSRDKTSCYKGEWQEDLWHGHGMHTCERGRYLGQFERGVCHGKGLMAFTHGMSGLRHPSVFRFTTETMPDSPQKRRAGTETTPDTPRSRAVSEAEEFKEYGRYIEGEWRHGHLLQPHERRSTFLPTC